MKLSAEFVDEVGELKEERKKLQAKEEDLVKKAKDLMLEEDAPVDKTVTKNPDGSKKIQRVYSPKKSEFEFVLTKFDCIDVKWRDEFQALYIETYGKKKWEKYLEEAPTASRTQLDVNRKEK